MQPFFLGGASGLALALAIAIGLFLSPIRKALYLEWDPELSRLRSKTEQIRARMLDSEMGLAAESGAAAGSAADSLRMAQAGAWKEYRHWRNRLGELSRVHDEARPSDFPSWAYSLRYGLSPLAAVLSLAPALFFAIRSARRPRRTVRSIKAPAKAQPKAPPRPQPSAAEALSSFQTAVKQVARIAEPALPSSSSPSPTIPSALPPAARPVADTRPAAPSRAFADVPLPASEDLPQEASPYEVESFNVFRAPEDEPPPRIGAGTGNRPEALETQIMQLGPGGWGEPRLQSEGNPPARPGEAGALSMEDEDGAGPSKADPPTGTFPPGSFAGAQQNGGAQNQFMPPTTEVERVERRKAEVVKLARKGLTSSEISRRLRISQDQVDVIIRMRREKG